jgi:hypothetical protein
MLETISMLCFARYGRHCEVRTQRARASLRIPSDPFLPIFPLMWRGVRGSSYRGGGLPLLTPSRNDNTTSPPPPPPHGYVMCMYVSPLSFLCAWTLFKIYARHFLSKKGRGVTCVARPHGRHFRLFRMCVYKGVWFA